MVPNIVFTATNMINTFPVNQPRVRVQVSRGREVTIKNEHLVEEGLYLFCLDEAQDHYYGVRSLTAPLALVKIKAILSNGFNTVTPKARVFKASVNPKEDYLPDGFRNIIQSLIGKDFPINELEKFNFEIKATEKVESQVTRMEVTSAVIEQQFRTTKVYNKDSEWVVKPKVNDSDDLFLAYVYRNKEKDNALLIDIGELWDENMINIDDLSDILSGDRVSRHYAQDWMESVSKLSDVDKQAIVDAEQIASRTRAFDDIMKLEDHNFDSNSN